MLTIISEKRRSARPSLLSIAAHRSSFRSDWTTLSCLVMEFSAVTELYHLHHTESVRNCHADLGGRLQNIPGIVELVSYIEISHILNARLFHPGFQHQPDGCLSGCNKAQPPSEESSCDACSPEIWPLLWRSNREPRRQTSPLHPQNRCSWPPYSVSLSNQKPSFSPALRRTQAIW